MSEQLKEAIENFDGKEKSNEALKESIRETVRNAVDNSVVNEQVLTEGVTDAVKNFFSKNDDLNVSYLKKDNEVAILTFSLDKGEFEFALVDNSQGKVIEKEKLNGKKGIKQKAAEMRERGFEDVKDRVTVANLAQNQIRLFAGIAAGSGLFLLATASVVLATASAPVTGIAITELGIKMTAFAGIGTGAVWSLTNAAQQDIERNRTRKQTDKARNTANNS